MSQDSQTQEQHGDAKVSALTWALVEAAGLRSATPVSADQNPSTEDRATATEAQPTSSVTNQREEPQRPLIVHVRDYKEIQDTTHGDAILRALMKQIRSRRRAGQPVVLIGTVSSAKLAPSLSRSAFRSLQSEQEDSIDRTIIVIPPRTTDHDRVLNEDRKRRVREVNIRHLQDMILQRAPAATKFTAALSESEFRFDSSLEYSSGLEERVWSYDRVHRLVMTALGLIGPEDELTPATISKALRVLDSSDETKFQWATEEVQEARRKQEGDTASPAKTGSTTDAEAKLKKVRKNCNSHELKLLPGVVSPGESRLREQTSTVVLKLTWVAESIRTTFADVHVPPETVSGIKALTMLSLIRPEAFSYGVLATDKIPGLLLYGPPGTGKTLLAKAVAKESGVTVLEVTGAEVYDMFVGEGEKNIKAIFTLARKLSPCIVFIDEADAIFNMRSSHTTRTSHRELINQFLREWDGMNDMAAFIMLATNRPFDLDDAVLRRLPRRLLVDLPVEKEREAILRIHLRDELLDASVSLADIARRTPFYSGSDLKNLAVAAALACVREETDAATTAAAKAGADAGPYQFPAKRVLAPRHFDKALEEISASISNDMSSLAAIRKFDEKYGERRGKRKRRPGWGFDSSAHSGETEKVRQ